MFTAHNKYIGLLKVFTAHTKSSLCTLIRRPTSERVGPSPANVVNIEECAPRTERERERERELRRWRQRLEVDGAGLLVKERQ